MNNTNSSIFFGGSDIPVIISSTEVNLDTDVFEVWHFVTPVFIHKMKKTDMVRIGVNTYQFIMPKETTSKFESGHVSMEIRIFDSNSNLVSVIEKGRVFQIKKTLIGSL